MGHARALITANSVRALSTLVNLSGDDHRIIDNCVVDIGALTAYRSSAGPNVDVERNGPCP